MGEEQTRSTLSARLERAAGSRWANYWLALVAFLNSFLIPLPAETILLPLCIGKPKRSWRYASIATLASVLGGLAGYTIGAFAFDALGAQLVAGSSDEFNQLLQQLNQSGTQWILLATITPLPYKLVTVTSGFAGMNLTTFVMASLSGRAIGYFLVAALCYQFGERAKQLLASSVTRATTIVVLIVAAYLLLSGRF